MGPGGLTIGVHFTWGDISRRLTQRISGFAQFSFNRSHTGYESSTGFSTSLEDLTFPAANPYNPFGVALTRPNTAGTPTFTFRPGTYRPKRVIENSVLSLLAGLRGTALKTWSWEAGVSYGSDHTKRVNESIRPADLQAALNGTTRATARNPFGPSENPDWPQKLFTSSVNQDFKIDALGADVSASARVLAIPLESAGEVGIATGYEFRREALRADADTAAYIGVRGGVPFDGRRFTHSVFLEVSLPPKKSQRALP
ncbi:MAG: hypothetical protein FJ399_07895 [Verrucomicrobia bacterium]|nr:hypothetical protein [Verrucomicrobiota bacterium]